MPGAGGTAQHTAHSPAERAARPPRRPLGQPACSPQHSQSLPGTQGTTQTPPGVNQNQFRPIQSEPWLSSFTDGETEAHRAQKVTDRCGTVERAQD